MHRSESETGSETLIVTSRESSPLLPGEVLPEAETELPPEDENEEETETTASDEGQSEGDE